MPSIQMFLVNAAGAPVSQDHLAPSRPPRPGRRRPSKLAADRLRPLPVAARPPTVCHPTST